MAEKLENKVRKESFFSLDFGATYKVTGSCGGIDKLDQNDTITDWLKTNTVSFKGEDGFQQVYFDGKVFCTLTNEFRPLYNDSSALDGRVVKYGRQIHVLSMPANRELPAELLDALTVRKYRKFQK